MKTIVFVTADRFPNGNAGAVRTMTLALLYRDLGYSPFVICLGDNNKFKTISESGIQYRSLRMGRKSAIFRLFSQITFPFSVLIMLKKLSPSEIAGVMFVSGFNRLFLKLKRYCKKNNIPLLHDSVEWYSPSEFHNGEKNWAYKANNTLNTQLIDNTVRVIAISSYLEKYFYQKGITVQRIPSILDINSIVPNTEINEHKIIRIIYAGMPGTKDHLKELIDAYYTLSENEKNRLHIRIVGITREKYDEIYGNKENNSSKNVVFEGRLTREVTLDKIRESDFAFLLRPEEERYAKAGFPTKVPESMSLGTVMLCNMTSDLHMYLRDGENCIEISSCTQQACEEALHKILKMSNETIREMKQNARLTAEKAFDYRNYKMQAGLLVD